MSKKRKLFKWVLELKVVDKNMANKAVLDQRQVDRILVLKSQELSNRLIAKRMGVHRKHVDAVVRGEYKLIHLESGYGSLSN